MKLPKPKFSLPKIRLPKLRAPKIGLPKFGSSKSAPAAPFDVAPFDAVRFDAAPFEIDAGPNEEGALETEFEALIPADRIDEDPKQPKASKNGRGRKLVIGASALAVLGAGGLSWFFLKPMLGAHDKPARQAVAKAPEKPGEAPKMAEAGAEGEKSAEARPAAAKTPEKPEAVEAKPAAAEAKPEGAEKPAEKAEKSEGGEKAAQAPLPLPPPPSEPELLIRRLQGIQERVAGGDPASFGEMPRLLHTIAQKFIALPPETWARKENAQALVLYLLSGGSPAVGRRILGGHKFAESEEPLAKAAIAYLEGIEGPDRDLLLNLDSRALNPDLGAQVAFVQSILLTNVDHQKAIASLDLARLLAPGSLVEEAALRREVALLSETKQFDKFADLARQYWERFRRSPYADNFLRQFMLSAARVSLDIKVAEWAELDEFISSLTPQTQRKLYLAMSETAAVGGNSGLADMAAQRALALSPADSVERQRALLYRAAAEVGGADLAQGPGLLREVERAKLPADDQPLYDAVATVSARIFRTPQQKFNAPPPGGADDVDASLARAEKGVQEADAVMDSVRKSMERKTR